MMATAEEIAKAIVAEWGYEEAGWWEPIKQALQTFYMQGWVDGANGYKNKLTPIRESYNTELGGELPL